METFTQLVVHEKKASSRSLYDAVAGWKFSAYTSFLARAIAIWGLPSASSFIKSSV
jgi:hypothetical protein